MNSFDEFLEQITNDEQRNRTREVLDWVKAEFPDLESKVAWNQPMFCDHGTFIIGFSVSSKHLAVSPELAGMLHFTDEIKAAGYAQGRMLFRIPWNREINYVLLRQIIAFNCFDKRECKTFWRK